MGKSKKKRSKLKGTNLFTNSLYNRLIDTLKDPFFWLSFGYFILACFLAFYIPGSLILKKLRLKSFDNLILSIIVGIVLWGWQGFIFGHLGARGASYLYLAATFLIWIRVLDRDTLLQKLRPKLKKISLSELSIAALIILGTSYLTLTIFLTGVYQKGDLYFCCGLPDSLYQLALTNQLVKQFPPIEPGASGVFIQNYHYLSNLITADLVRVFHLPLINMQYQYLVILFSLLHGLSALTFARILHLGKKYVLWLLFFLYFSGDILFILLFILGKGFDFSLPFLHHSGWLWVSPSRVFASVIFFGGISLLSVWFKKKSLYLGIILTLIFSILFGIKIYVGIFVLAGLGGLTIYSFFRRDFNALSLSIITLVFVFFIHLSVSSSAGAFDFVGLWRFENFIADPKLDLIDWELKRQTFIAHQNYPRIMQWTLTFIATYFIFIFGTLNLSFLQTKKSLKLLPQELNIFLFSGISVSLILGSFFIQDTGGANSSQFLITVMIILSIYSALAVFYWTQLIPKPWEILVISIVVLFTVPRMVYFTKSQFDFQKVGGGHYVKAEELKALNFLKTQTLPSSIILADNIDKNNWRNAYSFYISFLSNRQIFLDGKGITQDHGVNVSQKLKGQMEIFESTDSAKIKNLLEKNNITYIYMAAGDQLSDSNSSDYLQKAFVNDKVKLLRVKNSGN